MDENGIFCRYEKDYFPSNEFENHPEFGQVHERPPNEAPRHTTSGQLLPEEKGAVTTWSLPGKRSPS